MLHENNMMQKKVYYHSTAFSDTLYECLNIDGKVKIHIQDYQTQAPILFFYDDNDLLHSTTGAAIIFTNGTKEYRYHGKKLDCSNIEEFNKLIKLQAFW